MPLFREGAFFYKSEIKKIQVFLQYCLKVSTIRKLLSRNCARTIILNWRFIMKNERILSYKMSRILSVDELHNVSAAGWTNYWTANATYQGGHYDGTLDASIDM
jgi:hypothetical protein